MAQQRGTVDVATYTYQPGADESISEAVARAVAAASRCDKRGSSAAGPADPGIAPPLYAIVDPDALNDLFVPTADFPRHRGAVSFPFAGYRISIDATCVITVTEG